MTFLPRGVELTHRGDGTSCSYVDPPQTAFLAATTGEIKAGDAGWIITLGFASSPFGDCLIANSPRGICRLDFVERRDPAYLEMVVPTKK